MNEESLEWENLSYANKVEALKANLASGNVPRYRRHLSQEELGQEGHRARRAKLRAQATHGGTKALTEGSEGRQEVPYAPMPPDPPQAVWRIWSNRHQKWFLPGAVGYTHNIEESGRFMPMEALAIYETASLGWLPNRPFPIGVTLVPA